MAAKWGLETETVLSPMEFNYFFLCEKAVSLENFESAK